MGRRVHTRSEFFNLPVSGQNQPIQVANSFQTNDGTGTPVVSPLAYSSTTIYTLTVPPGAVQVVLFPSTDLRVSEVANQSQYDIVPAGTKETIPCAGLDFFYIAENSADGSLRFKFIIV